MVKSRFTSFDVSVVVTQIQEKCLGLRVANLYDINNKTYLLKLAKPDHKCFLLLESAIRIHTTKFEREKNDVPSVFTLKLRKHLRTKRLEAVRQYGIDRVIDFTFGQHPADYHLIVELYASGNIILTDGDYKILTLLRTHRYDEQTLVATNQIYPTHNIKHMKRVDNDMLRDILSKASETDLLKAVLNKNLDVGPMVVEHSLLLCGQEQLKMKDFVFEKHFESLFNALKQGESVYDSGSNQKGYIILGTKKVVQKEIKAQKPQKKKKGPKGEKDEVEPTVTTEENKQQVTIQQDNNDNNNQGKDTKDNNMLTPGEQPSGDIVLYEDFVPVLFEQFKDKKYLEFSTFDEAVDEFFSKMEAQKIEVQKANQEENVLKKLEKVEQDQKQRIDALQDSVDKNERYAQLIELNLNEVDIAINIIRSYIAQALDWVEINNIVKSEKKKGNPIANMIHRLKLDSNQITMLLNFSLAETSDEDVTLPVEQVDVDLSMGAYANAQVYYQKKKKSQEKKKKTMDVAEQAYKAAEKKTRNALKEVKVKASIQKYRKPYWFEKFHWFISSENYLVLSGKDAQQNEMIVKRYMKKGDIYVHADLHGASSCIIKNPSGNPIPPLTLSQAGAQTVCRSSAWNAKVVTSAYWVFDNQVSKTAPTGEYLVTGSFMIRGKKNYLPPAPLIMGFGFMFKIDESCLHNHLNDRAPKTANEDEDQNIDDEADLEVVTADQSATADGQEKLRRFEKKKLKKQQKEMEETGSQSSGNTTTAPAPAPAPTSTEPTEPTTSTQEPQTKQKTSNNSDRNVNFERYGLEASSPQEVDESGYKLLISTDTPDLDDEKQNAPQGRKKISATERKRMKKGPKKVENQNQSQGQSQNQEDGDEVDGDDATSDQNPTNPKQQQQQQQQQQKQKPQKQAQKSEPEQAKAKAAAPPVRGKKGKLKKMKEKYADQDEEDRQLIMAMLASAGKKPAAADEGKNNKKGNVNPGAAKAKGNAPQTAKNQPQKQQQQQQQQGKQQQQQQTGGPKKQQTKKQAIPLSQQNNNSQTLETGNEQHHEVVEGASVEITDRGESGCSGSSSGGSGASGSQPAATTEKEGEGEGEGEEGEGEVVDGEELELDDVSDDDDDDGEDKGEGQEVGETAAASSGLSHRQQKKLRKQEEMEEVKKILEEENIAQLEDDTIERLKEIDYLISTPVTDDVLLFAIPVCAPYAVLSSYKFKVKLTPGHMKRGKAVQAATVVMNKQQEATAREKELMKNVPDTELLTVMVSNCKVNTPGLFKATNQLKAKNKAKAKKKEADAALA